MAGGGVVSGINQFFYISVDFLVSSKDPGPLYFKKRFEWLKQLFMQPDWLLQKS